MVSGGKRKRQLEAKPLRSQLIIEQAHKARAVPLPPPRKKVRKKHGQHVHRCLPGSPGAVWCALGMRQPPVSA